jgi:serine protease SohB
MAFWLDIAAFALKALLIVAALGGLAAVIALLRRSGAGRGREIEVRSLNERYDQMRDELDAEILDRKERRSLAKARKREAKMRAAKTGAATPAGKRIYVLGFKGDLRASAVKRLAREIDAVLTVARPETDEVVLRLQSAGGTVTGYGLAASEVSRLRARKIKVTVSVDQVAASGGYMMACAGDRVVAAPFALIGSIGVVAQAPNLHRFLKKNDIDYEELTAGEFKRSVSVLGEITPAGREHFLGKIEDIHTAFKSLVAERRRVAGERGREPRPGGRLVDRRRSPLPPEGRGARLRGRNRGAQDAPATASRRLRLRGAIGAHAAWRNWQSAQRLAAR